MRSNQHTQLRTVCGILTTLLIAATPAWAQRGGEPSLLGMLEREEVQTELQISEEQLGKLDELRESLNDRSGFVELMRKSREAESEAERAQIREQMRNYAETRRNSADEKLSGVLTESQMARLQQLSMQFRGLRALASDDVGETLKLTDEQKQQITALVEEQQTARRELGFQVSDEEREQFRAEWDRKLMVVLTDGQRQQWTTMTGPPIGEAPAAVASAAPAQTPTTQQPDPDYSPPPADAEVVSSFGSPTAEAEPTTRADRRFLQTANCTSPSVTPRGKTCWSASLTRPT